MEATAMNITEQAIECFTEVADSLETLENSTPAGQGFAEGLIYGYRRCAEWLAAELAAEAEMEAAGR